MSSPSVELEKSNKNSKSKVSVIVRCRPFLPREVERLQGNKEIPFVLDTATGKIELPARNEGEQASAMQFDYVYNPNGTTREIYDDVLKDMVASTVEGYNGKKYVNTSLTS
jgi:hypothetical protein